MKLVTDCLNEVIVFLETRLLGRELHWDAVLVKEEFRNWVDLHWNRVMAMLHGKKDLSPCPSVTFFQLGQVNTLHKISSRSVDCTWWSMLSGQWSAWLEIWEWEDRTQWLEWTEDTDRATGYIYQVSLQNNTCSNICRFRNYCLPVATFTFTVYVIFPIQRSTHIIIEFRNIVRQQYMVTILC